MSSTNAKGYALGHKKGALHLINRLTPPLPFLNLVEVKEHLEIEHGDRDSLIEGFIAAACSYMDGIDGVVGKALMPQAWEFSYDRFLNTREVYFPLTPVASLTSVTYYDTDGQQQTFDLSKLTLYTNEDFAYVRLNTGEAWPALYDRPDAITFKYNAGFANIESVPQDLKQAALLLVGHWFHNREAVSVDKKPVNVPMAFDVLVNKYRIGWVK